MKHLKIILSIFIITFLYSCDDTEINIHTQEEVITDPEPVTIDLSDNFGNEITRDFLGRIIDINKQPIANTTISIGNKTAQTDNNGIFIIKDATVFEQFAYIKAQKSGYINGSRTLIPTTGTNKLTIMLLDDSVTGTTASGQIDTINLANGTSVTLNGEFIDENGATYNGNVNVVVHHLNPIDENIEFQMPGSLYASNINNEERLLQSLGMIAVELKGENNEKLNIATNSTAEIKIPVDNSLLNNATETINLWYFNEDKGYWVEEGSATLINNVYVGTVKHFSFWNWDANFPTVTLCINVADENGNPVVNQSLGLSFADYPYPRTGVTDENGQVCGLIPSNQDLELNAYNSDICGGNSIYTSNVGSFTSDSSIDVIIPSTTDVIPEKITGTFNNCDDNAIINGYVLLTYGNQTFFDNVNDGNFEINLLRCNDLNTFIIEGVDFDNLETTGEINYTFSTPITNLGTIASCNSTTEFIQYVIDGSDQNLFITNIDTGFSLPSGSGTYPTIYISSSNQNTCIYLNGNLNDTAVGSYNYNPIPNYLGGGIGFTMVECIDMTENNNNVIFNLTTLGNIGEYIDINFSGDYEGYNGDSHTITGVVHVIRDN